MAKEQMTLGQLIERFKEIMVKYKPEPGKEEIDVMFDFVYFFPTSIDSERGDYSHLALGYETNGCSGNGERKPFKVSEFLKFLEESLYKDFEGWKGGTYTSKSTTPIWVANPGEWGKTAVVGVKVMNGDAVIITKKIKDF